ncbi:AI-2E family transporter [Acidisphaera sp. L21]|uniref:AI-2E family transporter n=1 Tax=Acidisphaera sp. L21 TaxID=1641851 RepID=UPI001C208EF0|nr:AI-2E family transporter [Acidisphaera sp. L21]
MDTLPPATAGSTRPQQFAMGALGLALVCLGVYTLWNFISALVWAGIFAIALWPLYHRAITRFGTGHHNILLPAVFTLAVALVFIVPLGVIGVQLAHETHNATEWLRHTQENGIPEPEFLHHLPFFQAQVDSWWQANLTDPGSARELVQRTTRGHVSDVSRMVGTQIARRLTLFIFTLLTLFFLFKEGRVVTDQLRIASNRAFGPNGERIGRQIIASVHGTVDGLVLVGLGEGLILGVIYAIAGVPHPTIFGALTAVAAMIPFAAPVIFVVAALFVIAQGSLVWGVTIIVAGFAVTFIADHFIRPVLIGGATKLPFIWVLLGILGGVEEWGLIGLFLGPAIMAALILLWREWACGRRPM